MANNVFYRLFICLLWSLISRAGAKQPLVTENKHTVCYDELGCFSSLPPFHPDMPLPLDPKRLGTKFYLHNRHTNREKGYYLETSEKSIMESDYNPSLKTKIIIHGFVISNTELASWVAKVTQAILDKENVNVIVVNWIGGARLTYDQAVSNTRVVGAQTGYLIKSLMEYKNANSDQFHIIGFSLGAHVAGFAGKSVKTSTHMIGRITGLDPANPGFNEDSEVVRLDKSDAKFVDVIHTDTSTLLFTASGINRNIGHADFYPNGGEMQPGCSGDWSNSTNTWFSSVSELTVCDHLRAPRLFMNSINMTEDCTFTAYKCKSYEKFKQGKCLRCSSAKTGSNRCSVMGYWAEKPRSKNQVQYYLQTTGAAPFCVKNYQVHLRLKKHAKSTDTGFKGKLFVTLKGDKGSTKEMALNDGTMFHMQAGKITRFLVTIGCENDIGNIREVEFRWEREQCWFWLMCASENVFLHRIKVIDATKQKQYTFVPVRNDNSRGTVVEIKSDEPREFLRKTSRNRSRSKAAISKNNLLTPELINIKSTTKRKRGPNHSRSNGIESNSILSEDTSPPRHT